MMDNDFQKRLLATFKIETREHLTALSSGLIELEQAAGQEQRQKLLEAGFREAHSLKGAARSVNVAGIASLSHALESVFAAFKREECSPSAPLFDLLHRAIDTIDKQLLAIETGQNTAATSRARELVASLEKAVKGAPASSPPPVIPEAE